MKLVCNVLEAASVSQVSDTNYIFIWLIGQEDFIAYSCHESFQIIYLMKCICVLDAMKLSSLNRRMQGNSLEMILEIGIPW